MIQPTNKFFACAQVGKLRFWLLLLDMITMFFGVGALGYLSSMFHDGFPGHAQFWMELSENPVERAWSSTGHAGTSFVAVTGNFLNLMMLLNACWIHIICCTFPLVAECQRNYRWYYPWMVFLMAYISLEVILVMNSVLAGLLLLFVYALIALGYTLILFMLTLMRRDELKNRGEAELRHVVALQDTL